MEVYPRGSCAGTIVIRGWRLAIAPRATVLTGFQDVEDNLAGLVILGRRLTASVSLIKAPGGGWSTIALARSGS